MTNRERLFSALRGDAIDRTPTWLLFPYHPTPYYANVRATPSYAEVQALSEYACVILDRRNLGNSPFAPSVDITQTEHVENGLEILRTEYHHGQDVLYSEQSQYGTVKYILQDETDLKALANFPINTDPTRIAAELEKSCHAIGLRAGSSRSSTGR